MSDKTPEAPGGDQPEDRELVEDGADLDATDDGDESESVESETPTGDEDAADDDTSDDEDVEAEDSLDEAVAEHEKDFSDDEQERAKTIVRKTAKAPVKKTTATKKRSESQTEATDPYGPTNPINFVRQSWSELRRVVWPTWPQLVSYFLAVLIFVLFMIAYVGVLDWGFGWGLLRIFGDNS